jgi:4'-phosphopantetheinyl transferase
MTAPVQLWLAASDERWGTKALRQCHRVLSADERERAGRYRLRHHRRRYLVGRVVLRRALSRLRPDVPPERWRFGFGRRGRPHVAGPAGADELRFSLSYSGTMVACAVVEGGTVGVDLERLRPRPFLALADDFFTSYERRSLHRTPAGALDESFYSLWTLKESYMKARGLGFALPPHTFGFEQRGPSLRLHLEPNSGDRAAAWHFMRMAPTRRHRLALALRAPGAAVVPVEVLSGALFSPDVRRCRTVAV